MPKTTVSEHALRRRSEPTRMMYRLRSSGPPSAKPPVGHHGRPGAAAHGALQRLAAVGQEQAGHVGLVAQRRIHREGRRPGGEGPRGGKAVARQKQVS